MVFIYALLDPRDQAVRYIGKTNQPLKRRLRDHIWDCVSQTTYRAYWVKHLLSLGMKPIITLLEEVPKEYWREAETFWIEYFRRIGARLTNATCGGDGGDAPSVATRARLRAASTGRQCSAETRAKIGNANRGKTSWLKGKTLPEETRAKISAARRGKPSGQLGKKLKPETYEKLCAANRARAPFHKGASPQTLEKMRQGNIGKKPWNAGKKLDAQMRAKIGAGVKRRFQEHGYKRRPKEGSLKQLSLNFLPND